MDGNWPAMCLNVWSTEESIYGRAVMSSVESVVNNSEIQTGGANAMLTLAPWHRG